MPNFALAKREHIYIWTLARNLLTAKRGLRLVKKLKAPQDVIEFNKGIELEAHNRYYSAKEFFGASIVKE